MEDILPYLDKAFLATEDVLPNLLRVESELEEEVRALTHPFNLLSPEFISRNVQLMTARRAVEALVNCRSDIIELKHRVEKRPYRGG